MTALDRINQALNAAEALAGWTLGVLRETLPATIVGWGRSARARVVDVWPGGGLTERGEVVTSLMGQTRLDARRKARADQPVIGILPLEDQFRITTELSAAAIRAGRSAIALRLESLSPIPLEEAAFAFRRLSPPGVTPVKTEVSIIRRSSLDAAANALKPLDRDWRLVGGMDADGRASLEFGRAEQRRMNLGLKAVIVSAAVAVAMIAWAGRLESDARDLEAQQGALASQARQAADIDRRLEAVALARTLEADAVRTADWMQALSELADQADAYSAIRVADRQVSIERNGARLASQAVAPPISAAEPGAAGAGGEATP